MTDTARVAAYRAALDVLAPFDDDETDGVREALERAILVGRCGVLLARCEAPVWVVSEANRAPFEHWSKHQQRAKDQRGTIALVVQGAWGRARPPKLPLVVRLTVLSPTCNFMDDDNLQTACKALRDGIADWLGVDDGTPSIVWRYRQAKHPLPKGFGVRVEVYGPGP